MVVFLVHELYHKQVPAGNSPTIDVHFLLDEHLFYTFDRYHIEAIEQFDNHFYRLVYVELENLFARAQKPVHFNRFLSSTYRYI